MRLGLRLIIKVHIKIYFLKGFFGGKTRGETWAQLGLSWYFLQHTGR